MTIPSLGRRRRALTLITGVGALALEASCGTNASAPTDAGPPNDGSPGSSGSSPGRGSGSGSSSGSSGPGSSSGGDSGANADSGAVSCPYAAQAAARHLVDGCSGAPAGIPPYPALLAPYGSSRPPWDVAGVDYDVGVPAGTILRDPTAGMLPSCATYDAASHTVQVTASACTLDAFDFTRAGGLQLSIPNGITGTTVTRCRFGLAGNPAFSTAILDRRGGDLTVAASTFEGPGQGAMYFDTGASGTVSFEYDLFSDIDGDAMDFGSSQTVVFEYSACVKFGMAAGAHPDCVQFCGGALDPSSHESFDLVYEPVGVTVGGAQGIQIAEQCGGTVNGYSADHDAVIAPDATNLTMSYSVAPAGGSNVTVSANYVDSTGAYGPFYPANPQVTCEGNVALTAAHGFTAGANITGTFGTMTCK